MHKRIFALLAATLLAIQARAALPSLPQPATSFGGTVAHGWLYIYGGNTGKAHEFHTGCIKGDFFRLQLPAGDRWEPLEPGPALLSPALVSYAGQVIRIGGMTARNVKGEKNDLHSTDAVARFDPKTQRWTALPPLPAPRSSHDAVIVDDKLYVAGGWSLAGPGKETWHTTMLILDLKQSGAAWRELPQPFERRALAMQATGKRIWFLGGMNSDNEPAADVDWFDTDTGTWGKGPHLPEGPVKGFGLAACATAGRLYVSPLSGEVLTLADDGRSWHSVAKLSAPRFFHRLVAASETQLLAVGGSNRQQQLPNIETVSLPGKSAGWPQWRGPKGDGVSDETGWRKDWTVDGPPKLWAARVGVGMSSPVAARGKLILHGNDGEGMDTITALDASTGQAVWKDTVACVSKPHEMPIVPPGPGATPTIDAVAGRVYALSREGELRCLRLDDGVLVWAKNLIADLGGKRPVYGYSESPVLTSAGRLIVEPGAAPGEPGSTAALEAATGELFWKGGRGEAGYSSPRLLVRDGREFIVAFKGEGLQLLDAKDGRLVTQYATTARDFSNATTPALLGHRVLVSNTGTDPAVLLDWAPSTPAMTPVWSHKQFALLFNSAIAQDGCLFGFNEKRRGHHEFTCIDIATGETRWVSDRAPTGTFILADAHWVILTRDGAIVIAPASRDRLEPVSSFQALNGKCYATPCLLEGRLYVRDNAGEVAAFDLRAAREADGSSARSAAIRR